MQPLSFTLFALLLVSFSDLTFSNNKARTVLVLSEGPAIKDTHSSFFSHLSGLGFKLKFVSADSKSLELIKYGEKTYDHLVVFAPSTESFGGSLNLKTFEQYIALGGNILVAGSSSTGSAVRDLAELVGFQMGEEGTSVIDHVNSVAADHTTVKSSNFANIPVITGSPSGPVFFRGTGMVLDTANTLALEVLSGSSTCYTYNPSEAVSDYPHAVGSATVLVGALQARNNARVVVSGSLDLFSNDFFTLAGASNEKFAQSVASWVFQESGVLSAGKASHYRVASKDTPREYTITEDVVFELPIQEKVNGQWVAFGAKDVQLEFVRIDPFVRTVLESNNGVFTKTFKLPDVYGVFKFVVDYQRPGYSYIHSSTQVSVRPFRHNQYERFLVAAYPYYAGALSMLVGLFLFSFIFMNHKDKTN